MICFMTPKINYDSRIEFLYKHYDIEKKNSIKGEVKQYIFCIFIHVYYIVLRIIIYFAMPSVSISHIAFTLHLYYCFISTFSLYTLTNPSMITISFQ